MTFVAHVLNDIAVGNGPYCSLQLECDAKVATVWITLAEEARAVETHGAARTVAVPLWRPGQLHLKVEMGRPLLVYKANDCMVVRHFLFQLF